MRLRPLAAAIGLLGAMLAPAFAQTPEDLVKAAYLTKFIPFIDWPDTAFASPTAPVTICVLGADPFGDSLDKAAHDAKTGERAIVVRRMAEPDPDAACHLLFLGGIDPAIADSALGALKGRAVVTVTDTGAAAHGIITFVTEQKQVRFDIDDALAAQAGLSISSKLLGLARNVKQRGGQ